MRRFLLVLLLQCTVVWLWAQTPIHFGGREVYLEANVQAKARGVKSSSLELGTPDGDRLNVLVQLNDDRTSYDVLKAKGVVLGSYLGSNAYYASVRPGSRPSDFAGTGLRAVVPIRGEWKVVQSLLQGNVPTWAVEGDNLKMTLTWFATTTWEQVRNYLGARGITYSVPSNFLRSVDISGTREAILSLAEQECVAFIRWCQPPMVYNNNRGSAQLSGASILRKSTALGGRGLTGKGVRIGVWDGNVGEHVDYGARVHTMEYEDPIENSGGHGMHTTGTICGSGLLDEGMRGMAPEAEVWTYNFGANRNGKVVAEEMIDAYNDNLISLTSNSYGMQRSNFCGRDALLTYTNVGNQGTDYIAYHIPELTHVYSAGNEQNSCGKRYFDATNYAKNIISVAAVDKFGAMTDFSSFGPLRDGRTFPIISASGKEVYSTVNAQKYIDMEGTSMSCPTVTGHLALLTQRWMQLHGGATPYNYFLKALIANTARDAGNVGPDYQFGFGILDGIAAVTALESNWYKLQTLERGGAPQTFSINVPAGVKELRVMLCWNDPVAEKEYADGECPLVNDLDLTVSAGSTTYWPYTLDFKNPDAPAVATKKNAVDNIEQVVIKAPTAGTVTVEVAGVVKQEEKQPYAVVWYFDYQQPVLYAPLAAEVYAPSDEVYFRVENMKEPLRFELSFNGGETYLVSKKPYKTRGKFRLPPTIPPTDKALIRLTDAEGRVVQSDMFTVMSRVEDLQLQDASCETAGWKLAWEEAQGAAKYEILRAVVAEDRYEKIGEVNAPATEFAIPQANITNDRNIFAVRAVSASGLVGARSVGVLSEKNTAVVIKMEDLPYLESFVGTPLRHVALSKGANLGLELKESAASLHLPFGSQTVALRAFGEATAWDKPFEQVDNLAKIDVCQVDLSEVPKGTELFLVAYGYLTRNDVENGTLLRLIANGKEVQDVLGRTQIPGDNDEHRLSWDISEYAGEKKVKLSLEVAMQKFRDAASLVYFRITNKVVTPDLSIAWANSPKIEQKVSMKQEDIRFKLRNNSSLTLQKMPVTIFVDGKGVYSEVVEELKPFADKVISYTHDFSSREAHKFQVEIRAELENDARPANNIAQFEVYNLGEVIAMPKLTYVTSLGTRIPKVPYIAYKLTEPRLFVDAKGALEPYIAGDQAVLQILPQNPNNQIQVTFYEYDLAQGDLLYVYTGNVIDNLHVNANDATVALTGKSKAQQIFLSEATNGGITFYFDTSNPYPGAGWRADVREVEVPNLWGLDALELGAGSDAEHKTILAKVRNHTNVPLYNVAFLVTHNGVQKRYEIPQLDANAITTFTLPKEIEYVAPLRLEVVAELVRDGDVSDNSKKLSDLQDAMWHGGTITDPSKLSMTQIRVAAIDTVKVAPSKTVAYYTSQKLPLYAKNKNNIEVALANAPDASLLPAQLRFWVDFNKNNQLEENELITQELETETTEYTVPIDLSLLTSVTPGKYRARAMVSTTDAYNDFKAAKTIAWGHVVDFSVEVKEGTNPKNYELELLGFVGLKSGRSLSGTTPIKVRVKNNGLVQRDKVKLVYTINGGTPVTENITCALAPLGGEQELAFNTVVDFSIVGMYEIEVKVAEENDFDKSNNTIAGTLYHLPPTTAERYGLKFVGAVGENVELPYIGHTVENTVTIEGWWKLDKAQRCELVNGSGIFLATASDNKLFLIVGENAQVVSFDPVITPGQWQHFAFVLEKDTDVTTITAYLDGNQMGIGDFAGEAFDFSTLWLNEKLEGQNAMFRIWKTARTHEEIEDNMTKSVRSNSNELPEECIGEYIFTEGQGTVSAFGTENYAEIHTTRTDVWTPLTQSLLSVSAEGEVTPAKGNAKDGFVVTMPSDFTDFANVYLSFVREWPGSVVLLNGTPVTYTVDFSAAPNHKLRFRIEKRDFVGKVLAQEVDVTVVTDLSSACDLLTLTMPITGNTGLKDEVRVENPSNVILLEAKNVSETERVNVAEVTLVANVSPNATLFYGDKSIASGTPFKVDMREPAVFRVLAQNGRDTKRYFVRLSMTQTLQWGSEKLVLPYSAAPIALDARASSGLEVQYSSQNPNIVTTNALGQLVTVGVGTTTLVATQQGDACYKPAANVSRLVEVTRVPLTIKMVEATMQHGEQLPEFQFVYDGLQFSGVEYKFDTTYGVRLPDGKIWNETMPPLPMGQYDVVPLDYTAPYEFENYTVTRLNGKLNVTTPIHAKLFTLSVNDENGAPVAEAKVHCGTIETQTSAEGKVLLYLIPSTYTVTVSKEGYVSVQESVKITDKGGKYVDVVLKKRAYTLTYKAAENGVIQGNTKQMVSKGGDAEEVIAVPINAKYRFVKWSDDNLNPVRKDVNISDNLEVQASFEAFTYQLTYTIGEGGEKVAGEFSQSVAPTENGTPVTVRPMSGYVFMGWSDGVMTLSRTDKNLRNNLKVEAYFYKANLLTWNEDFSLGLSNLSHWKIDKPSVGKGWQLLPVTKVPGVSTGSGNVLILDPTTDIETPWYQNVSAATPWLSIEDRGTNKVAISYVRYFKKGSFSTVARLQYCFDNGEWVDGPEVTEAMGGAPEIFTLDDATLSTHKALRFRWRFYSQNTKGFLALANVVVQYDPLPTQTMWRYIADEHGKVRKDGDTKAFEVLEVRGAVGTPVKVVAVPDDGYSFKGWSDGVITTERSDAAALTVKAYFERIRNTMYTVSYRAGENGSLYGITYQRVEDGSMSSPVLATPAPGYKFSRWNDKSTQNPRSELIKNDVSVVAEFVKDLPVYTLSYLAEDGGTIVGESVQQVEKGSNGSAVEAVPEKGYRFKKWSDGRTEAKRTETALNENKSLIAYFEALPTYAVTLAVEGAGSLVVDGYNNEMLAVVLEGTELMFTATPTGANNVLKSLMAGDDDILTTKKWVVKKAVVVKAVFGAPTLVDEATFANLRVSPNPFNNMLRVATDDVRGVYVLSNVQGVTLRSGQIQHQETTIETSDLSAGLYLLRVTAENGVTKVYRLVKE